MRSEICVSEAARSASHKNLPVRVRVEINRQLLTTCGYSGNTSTNCCSLLNFYLTGVARPHQTTCGNENSSTFCDLKHRFSHFSINGDIVWQKSDTNTHS